MRWFWLVLVLLVLAPRSAAAGELRWVNVVGAQLNPRGFGDEFRLRYRQKLYESESLVGSNNFAGAALGIAVGPIFRPTAALEIQPIAPLTLGVAYQPVVYPGLFKLAQGYDSPLHDYGSGVFSAPQGKGEALVVHQAVFNASLQMKAGPFVARSSTRMAYEHAETPAGQRVIYDPIADMAVYRRGWVLVNDSDAGVMLGPVIAGARHTLVATWYPSGAFAGPKVETHDSPTSRVGPFLAYSFVEKGTGVIESATVAGTSQWYVAHRFRTGIATPQWFPLMGIALTIVGRT